MKRLLPTLLLFGLAAISSAQNHKITAVHFEVTGAVRHPHPYTGWQTDDKGYPLSMAIGLAGGPSLQADESSVRISRSNREDVHVDYGAIMRGERLDVPLEDGDVIYVPFKPE